MKEQTIKITSADVYENGNIKLSALQKYMQQIAREDCDDYGASYENVRALGMVFVITKLAIEFYAHIKTDDIIVMKSVNNKIVGITFVREFLFFRNNVLIAASTTNWVLMDFINRKVCRASALNDQIPQLNLDIKGVEVKRRITKTELPHIGVHRVRYTELDENRHLNNAVYSDILIDYLPETVPNSHIKRCQINFNSEATLGDLLDIYSKKENDGFVMITKNITAQKVCFEAELFFD